MPQRCFATDLTSMRVDPKELFILGHKENGLFFLYNIRNTVFYLSKADAELAKETAIRANWTPPSVIGVYPVSILM